MKHAALRHSEMCAVELLCRQGFSSIYDMRYLAVPRLHLPVAVLFASYTDFCRSARLPRAELTRAGGGAEGLTVRRGGKYLVLFDDLVENEGRRTFTLAHEVGHILLAHAGGADAPCEEREANAFAASLLCPAIAVHYLERQRGRSLTAEELCAVFPLSRAAAVSRLTELHRKKYPPADAEITLLLQLFGKISSENKGF